MPRIVATIGGIANFCGQLSAISAPIVTGYIVYVTHSFTSAFTTATVILLLGVFGYAVLLGKIQRIAEPSTSGLDSKQISSGAVN